MNFLLLAVGVMFSATPPNLRASVSLDIYNRDLALVRDVRVIDLAEGDGEADFVAIANGIFGHTVRVDLEKPSKGLETRELSYNFDLLSLDKLTEKYLGRWFSFQAGDSEIAGRLLSMDEKHLFLQPDTNDNAIRVVERSKLTELTCPTLPEGLFTRPTIRWKYHSDKSRIAYFVELSYLTSDVNWYCDYRGELVGDDQMLLSANFTIANDLPIDFPDAKVSLVVGKPHRSTDPEGRVTEDRVEDAAGKSVPPKGDGAERVGEFYRFPLPRPINLALHQTIQTPYFPAVKVKCEKRYFFPHLLDAEQVLVQMRIDDVASATGSAALPEGDIGLYRRTSDGDLTFIGEDQVPITPAGSRLDLTIGAAPDISARRVRLSQMRPTRDTHEETWQVNVVNARKEPVRVWVEQRAFGYFEVTKSEVNGKPVPPVVVEAGKLHFPVDVPASGSAELLVTLSYGF